MTVMQAGRELDALIAERVMKWKPEVLNPHLPVGSPGRGTEYVYWRLEDGMLSSMSRWHFSTDIAVAWEVVERLTSQNKGVFISRYHSASDWWVCIKWRDGVDFVYDRSASTVPLAICLAALAAVEKEANG